jgi:DNA-binding transcriptional ArsR family regulator
MRIKPMLSALFSETRRAILSALVLEPERSWYLSDLAAHLGRPHPSSLQRELESLVMAEILTRRKDGNRVYYQANRSCPVYSELLGLFTKTTGLFEIVLQTMKPFTKRIKAAFIHGSMARSDSRVASDVDLIVVGNVGLAELAPALRAAEERLSRAINATVYSKSEFAAKVAAGNHFLLTVLKHEKTFLIGSQNELEELANSRARAAPRHQQARARRSAVGG